MDPRWPIQSLKPWALIIAFVLYDLALTWWATIPPTRPKNIPSGSVFATILSGGFILPLPKHGDWLYCWLDQERMVNRWQMTATEGKLEYEGEFTPSDESGQIAQADLVIDRKATGSRLQWVYFREEILPIIHLRNGKILIPVEASEMAKQKLKFEREYHH